MTHRAGYRDFEPTPPKSYTQQEWDEVVEYRAKSGMVPIVSEELRP